MAVHVKLSADGHIPLPPEVLEQLGLAGGDDLVLEISERGLVIQSVKARVRKAQQLYREMLGDRPGLSVDDFIADKREQARLEEEREQRLHGR